MESSPEVGSGLNHQIVMMPVERLLLDRDNPRLSSTIVGNTQFDLVRVLWTEMTVDELVLSIAANGYFPEEPLFVIPEHVGSDPDNENINFIVIEGNRRLAAVLILLHDDWRKDLRVTGVPQVSESDKAKLRSLPVSIYRNREKLWAYLSFRHINSPKPWDAYSKAKYVAHVHDDYGVSLDDIARRIGDKHSTVLRLYNGFKVLQEAEKYGAYQVDDRASNRFYFSHLYTALAYPEFQQFLGIEPDKLSANNPVPETHLTQLRELLVWLYGKKSDRQEPLIRTQNPDLTRLRDVVGKPSALEALRTGYSLDTSYDISIGDERRFRESLIRVRQELKQASATVTTGYNGDSDSYEVMHDIQELVRAVFREMKRKFEKASSRR